MIKAVLHEGQLEVASDKHRFRVICAGRRWGKSVLSRLIVLKWAVEEQGLFWIVSPTYKQAKMIHWREITKEIPQEWIAKKNEVELSITLKNGSIIELKGAENPDALRGVKLKGLVIDEIASIRNWDWLWSEVLRPTLTDYEAPAIFISTPKGFNHFYELFQQGQQDSETFKSWRFTSYDNPYISPKEIDLAKEELTEDTFAQEYMADFRKHTGLVYKQFDRNVHVISAFDVPEDYEIYRGIDFGSTNPTACVWIAVDKDDNWFIVDEHYEAGRTIDYHSGVINSAKYSPRVVRTYGDPSGKQWMDEFGLRGVHITAADKQTGTGLQNWVNIGIEKVAERLKRKPGHLVDAIQREGIGEEEHDPEKGEPSLYVFKHCANTIMEFENYRWKEKSVTQAQDLNEPDVPEKALDHCFAWDTPVLTDKGIRMISSIKQGDKVWSPFGWNPVLKAGKSGIKETFDYGVFRCTPNHKIATSRGFVGIDTLRYSDKIMLWENLRPFTTKEFLIGVIQIPIKDQIGFILGGLLTKSLEAQRAFYIVKYGKSIMGKFLRVTTFIMLTAITTIMILKTFALSLLKNMPIFIRDGSGKVWKSILKVSDLLRRSGMHPKKGEHGIADMQKNNGRINSYLRKNAPFVESSMRHPSLVEANTAIQIAKPQPYGEEEVYNLGTKYGCYFAGGVLVSNCMDSLRYFAVSYRQQPRTLPPRQWDDKQWKIGK